MTESNYNPPPPLRCLQGYRQSRCGDAQLLSDVCKFRHPYPARVLAEHHGLSGCWASISLQWDHQWVFYSVYQLKTPFAAVRSPQIVLLFRLRGAQLEKDFSWEIVKLLFIMELGEDRRNAKCCSWPHSNRRIPFIPWPSPQQQITRIWEAQSILDWNCPPRGIKSISSPTLSTMRLGIQSVHLN